MTLYQVLSGTEFNKQFTNNKLVKLTNESEIHNGFKFKTDKLILGERKLICELEEWNDDNFCLEAVRRIGYALKYVKNQTEQMCLEAVKQHIHSLEYVHNQTEQICLAAIKESGCALLY